MTTARGKARRYAGGAALVLAGAVGATALTGLAYAQEAPSTPPVAAAEDEGGWMRGPGVPGLGPVLHGEAVVRDREGEIRTIVTQNGTIEEVAGSSITVKSEDGYSKSYTIGEDTKIRIDRQEAAAADLAKGRPARVVADPDGRATLIGSTTAEGQQQSEERAGDRQQLREAIRGFLEERFGQDSDDGSAAG